MIVPFSNQFMGGMSDDHFLSREGEVLDMSGIDVRSSPRHIQLDGRFLEGAGTSIGVTGVTKQIEESNQGWIAITDSDVSLNGSNKTSLFTGKTVFDKVLTIGSASSDYDATTNSYGMRHFVFDRGNLYVGDFDLTNLHTTVSLSGILNSATTAVAVTNESNILFARQNKIYELDAITYTLTATPVVTLPQGVVCKYIYTDNSTILSVGIKDGDTYFHTIRYDGIDYLIDYQKVVRGFECIDAIGNNGLIWWVSRNHIHAFSGDNQVVKSILPNESEKNNIGTPSYYFSSSARVAYNKDILKISDSTNYWEFGWDKPGYNDILTRTEASNLTAISKNYVSYDGQGSGSYINTKGSATKDGYVTIVPFTASQFAVEKSTFAIRVGYELPKLSSYTNQSKKCAIEVWIMTDSMRRDNDSAFIKILDITDETKTTADISTAIVSKKLEDAGYSDKWGWIKIKFVLVAGDPYTTPAGFYRKTPLLYNDFLIKYDQNNPDF